MPYKKRPVLGSLWNYAQKSVIGTTDEEAMVRAFAWYNRVRKDLGYEPCRKARNAIKAHTCKRIICPRCEALRRYEFLKSLWHQAKKGEIFTEVTLTHTCAHSYGITSLMDDSVRRYLRARGHQKLMGWIITTRPDGAYWDATYTGLFRGSSMVRFNRNASFDETGLSRFTQEVNSPSDLILGLPSFRDVFEADSTEIETLFQILQNELSGKCLRYVIESATSRKQTKKVKTNPYKSGGLSITSIQV